MKVIVRTWKRRKDASGMIFWGYEEDVSIEIDAYQGITFAEYATTPTAVTTLVRGRCQKMFLSAKENAIVVYVEPPKEVE